MKKLYFAKDYYKKLVNGKKRMTMRKGKVNLKEGEKVEVYCGGKRIGVAKIIKIKAKEFCEISKEDILKDGFKSKRKLKKALRKHYKSVRSKDIFSLIEFEWIEKC